VKKSLVQPVCFFLLLISSSGWALSFLHPAFNRLDLTELKELQKSESKDQELVLYFEAEALYWRGQLHGSDALLNSLKDRCRETRSADKSPQKEVVCFLAELGFGSEDRALGLHFKKEQILKVLNSIESKRFSFEEKAYLEGRILWKIPSALGGNAGKSLLGWESLRRLRPDLSCANFFMSQIYESQNKHQLARLSLQRALEHQPADARAVLSRSQGDISGEQGFYFGLIGSPAGGAGILIGKKDERLSDTQRKIEVAISAQSRGVYYGRLNYEDKETLEPFLLEGRLVAASEIDQFFGMGSQSNLNQLTEVSQSRSQGSLGLRRWFSSFYADAALGWYLREPSAVTGFDANNAGLRERQGSLISHFELGLKEPRGFHSFLRVSSAARGFASTHSFEVYRAGLKQLVPITEQHQLALETGFRGVTGQKPFGMLSQLSGNVFIPGVRSGRFRDDMVWHATAEYQWSLGREFTLVGFGNMASLGKSMDELVHSRFLTGTGAALIIGKGGFQSRIEAGYFAGETVIQAGVQLFSE